MINPSGVASSTEINQLNELTCPCPIIIVYPLLFGPRKVKEKANLELKLSVTKPAMTIYLH